MKAKKIVCEPYKVIYKIGDKEYEAKFTNLRRAENFIKQVTSELPNVEIVSKQRV